MGVLTLYSMYVERGTFMVALEKPEAGLVSITTVLLFSEYNVHSNHFL